MRRHAMSHIEALDGPIPADHTRRCVQCGDDMPCWGVIERDEDGGYCRDCQSPATCEACCDANDAEDAEDARRAIGGVQ